MSNSAIRSYAQTTSGAPGSRNSCSTHSHVRCMASTAQSPTLKKKTEDTDQWLTFEELVDAVKSKTNAQILVDNDELPSRPSRYASLAAAGVKEYHYISSKGVRADGSREEAGTSSRAELTADEYKQVTHDVAASVDNGCSLKRKPVKPKTPETEEQKRFKAALQLRGSAIRRCKQLMDKAAGEVNNAEQDLKKLECKGYPKEMHDFFEARIQTFQGLITETQTMYGVEASRVDKTKPELAQVEKSSHSVDMMIQGLDAEFKKFKDGVASDIKKLAC